MPPSLVRASAQKEPQMRYKLVDEQGVEVPAESVTSEHLREFKPYQEVLEESIERRKVIASLKATQNKPEKSAPEDAEQVNSAVPVLPKVEMSKVEAPSFDPSALVAQLERDITAKVTAALAAAKQAEQEQEQQMNGLLREFKLPAIAREALAPVADPNVRRQIADALSRSGLRHDYVDEGGQKEPPQAEFLARLDKRLNLSDDNKPFG